LFFLGFSAYLFTSSTTHISSRNVWPVVLANQDTSRCFGGRTRPGLFFSAFLLRSQCVSFQWIVPWAVPSGFDSSASVLFLSPSSTSSFALISTPPFTSVQRFAQRLYRLLQLILQRWKVVLVSAHNRIKSKDE